MRELVAGANSCFARDAKVRIAADRGGRDSATSRSAWWACVRGAADRATLGLWRGRWRSNTCPTCIAPCAAIWICRQFPPNTWTACLPGCSEWFTFLRTAVRPAATGFSPSGVITASSPQRSRPPPSRSRSRSTYTILPSRAEESPAAFPAECVARLTPARDSI